MISDSQNIIVVEWADKIQDLLPKDAMWINFEHGANGKTRSLHILQQAGMMFMEFAMVL